MISTSMMAGFPDSRRSLSPARKKNARWQKLAAAFATPSHPAITHVPQGQALCGGAAPRTPVALGLPTSPSSGSVPSSAVRAEARSLFSAILLLLAVACSKPGSWEQFIRAEEAPGGVYEFVIPAVVTISTTGPGEAKASTFDLSFYTAPLSGPLQLEIAFSDLRETVWFPAGEHRALYRSGVRFSDDLSGNTPISLQVPPKNPLPVENIAEISTGTPKNTPTCIENGENLDRSAVTIQVTPINPPEDFRGLGIIIKRNDGTR